MKYVIYIVVLLGIGFFAGRALVKDSSPVIKYLPGEVITDTFELEPDTVEVPKIKWYPLKKDTVWLSDTFFITEGIDTAAVLADYVKKRTYNKTLFKSDTTGRLDITAVVQYNKLGKLAYEFTPVIVERTIHEKKLLVPFIKTSINTHRYFGVGGGIYKNNFGVGLDYINNTSLEDPGLEISVMRKF